VSRRARHVVVRSPPRPALQAVVTLVQQVVVLRQHTLLGREGVVVAQAVPIARRRHRVPLLACHAQREGGVAGVSVVEADAVGEAPVAERHDDAAAVGVDRHAAVEGVGAVGRGEVAVER
jgi:hypothetical protein